MLGCDRTITPESYLQAVTQVFMNLDLAAERRNVWPLTTAEKKQLKTVVSSGAFGNATS